MPGDLDSGFGAQSLTDLGSEILELWSFGADARASVIEVDADRLITNVGGNHVVEHRVAPAKQTFTPSLPLQCVVFGFSLCVAGSPS